MVFYRLCKTLSLQSLQNPSGFGRHPSAYLSVFFYSPSRPENPNPVVSVADYLVGRHNFSLETAARVSSVVTRFRKPEIADSALFFLKESGFSQTHVERVVKVVPSILSCNVEKTLKPKVKIFQDLGFPSSEIANIFSSDPRIFKRSLEKKLVPSLLALESILGSTRNLGKLLRVCKWYLAAHLEKTLLPNVEFVKSCGICSIQITKYMCNYPRLFLLKTETFKELARRTNEMGVDINSKAYLSSMRVMSSMSMASWKSKLQLFRDLGFAEADILFAYRRVPQVFAVSEKKIKQITSFLFSKGFEISFVCKHAEILLPSLENRIKPRFLVLENLERRESLLIARDSTTPFKMTVEQFDEKYVLPYADRSEESC